MNCRKCGAEIPPDSAFCIQCGEKVDAEQTGYNQQYEQAPYAQQPYRQPPYAQQPYGYTPQPAPKKTLSKGMKALIFGGAGAVVLAVVLILVFTLGGGGGGPFSGKTIQTQFVNEMVQFGNSVSSDFPQLNPAKIMSGPFEISVDASVDYGYGKEDISLAAVYDKLALGVFVEAGYGPTAVLIKDSVIVDQDGYVSIGEADTDMDMDEAMALTDRLTALFGSADVPDVDYMRLAEMFIDSIPEECFEKTKDSFTMTLEVDDLVDALNTFADKLEADKELNKAFEDLLDQMDADETELSELMKEAADEIDDYSSYFDYEIEYEIVYEGGKPVGFNTSVDSGDYGTTTMEMKLAGEDISVTYESTIALLDDYEYSNNMELLFTRVDKGYEFEGDLDTDGEHATVKGHLYWESDSFKLVLEAESDAGDLISIDADVTLSYEMPDAVEDDDRFDIDTEDAYTYDLDEMF